MPIGQKFNVVLIRSDADLVVRLPLPLHDVVLLLREQQRRRQSVLLHAHARHPLLALPDLGLQDRLGRPERLELLRELGEGDRSLPAGRHQRGQLWVRALPRQVLEPAARLDALEPLR